MRTVRCDWSEMLKMICRKQGKDGIFLSCNIDALLDIVGCDVLLELSKAVPFLSADDIQDLAHNSSLIVLFDSQGECLDAYEQVVGDEGPTKVNSYKGPACVYALTCDSNGQFGNENT